MNVKLTLTVDKDTIEQAKKYAQKKGRSLSDLIENYLKALTGGQKDKPEITQKVQKLRGSISLPKDLDTKKVYSDYLSKKHE